MKQTYYKNYLQFKFTLLNDKTYSGTCLKALHQKIHFKII